MKLRNFQYQLLIEVSFKNLVKFIEGVGELAVLGYSGFRLKLSTVRERFTKMQCHSCSINVLFSEWRRQK